MSGTHPILFQQAMLFKFTFYVSLLTIVKTLTSSDPGSRKLIVSALVIKDRRRRTQELETVFVLTDPRSLFTFSLESLFSSLPQFSLSVHYQLLYSQYLSSLSSSSTYHKMQCLCAAIILFTFFMTGEL